MHESGKEWRYDIENQHTIKGPLIFSKDIDLQRRMVLEAANTVGIPIEYYECCENKQDFYQDPDCKWKDAVIINGIFSDNPSVKVLKELGWYTEDDEAKPQIIYLPMYKDWTSKEVFSIKDNSLIKVYYFGQPSPAEFRITDKRMDSVYGCYWVCKLAPERLDNFYIVTQDGTHYLKRKYDREEDCEHKLADSGEDGRIFNHGDYEKYFIKNSDVDDYSSLVMGG